MTLQDVVDTTEVGEHADVRRAVLTERFDDAIVLDAVRLVSLERGHQLRIYDKASPIVKCIVTISLRGI